MEEEYSPFNWAFYYQEEGIEELKHSLLYTTLELENTLTSAHEELAKKGDGIMRLKSLLTKTIKEKEEAQSKCQSLIFEKFLLQQKLQKKPSFTINTETTCTSLQVDEPTTKGDSATGFSSSGCDENFTASPPPSRPPPPQAPPLDVAEQFVMNKTLPEKGKFLQAVMDAGPLLQTLFVAGPLPQWQHPPPPLNSVEIPPVTIQSPRNQLLLGQESCFSTSGCFSKKRGSLVHYEEFELSPNGKNQKVVHI